MKLQKKFFGILGCILVLVCISCTGFFDLGEEEITSLKDPNKPTLTKIYFDNRGNNFSVNVYYSSRDSKPCQILNNQRSDDIPWFPKEDCSFYVTYFLPLYSSEIPYIPKGDKGYISLPTVKDQTTRVEIPPLSSLITDGNEALLNKPWLILTNSGFTRCQLLRGTGLIKSESGAEQVNPSGGVGLFELPNGAEPGNYKILKGATETPLPADITSFQNGYVYVVDYNGSTATFNKGELLTLNNLFSF